MAYTRDRLTWLAFVLIAWFAYLQAIPGLIIPQLRDELHLSNTIGGLHVAAFASGGIVAGVFAARAERLLGRRRLLWGSAAIMAVGAIGLTLGRVPAATLGAMLVMGIAGSMVLITMQAVLSDTHTHRRAVALSEANVAASVAYVVLIGALALAATAHASWRAAVLASLVVPIVGWLFTRREPIKAPVHGDEGPPTGTLPRAFWVAAGMLFCTTAAEWCITAWGASFVEDAARVSKDTAVSLMVGYFLGVLAGRALGSGLARRHAPHRLLVIAQVVSFAGFLLLWPARSPLQAILGLALCGIGLGNLFPLGLSVAVALAADRAQLASGRAVMVGACAVLLAPLLMGALADALSISAALAIVMPTSLGLAAVALTLVTRAHSLAARSSA